MITIGVKLSIILKKKNVFTTRNRIIIIIMSSVTILNWPRIV
jgi:hypothetical protein